MIGTAGFQPIPGGPTLAPPPLELRTRPPGTEFLDAETGPQISPLKWVSGHRDKNPGNEWSEIPAETPYLALCRKRAVCEDWVVEVVGHKLATHHPVIEPVSVTEPGTEIYDAERGATKAALSPGRD